MKKLSKEKVRRNRRILIVGATLAAVMVTPIFASASLDAGGFKVKAVNTSDTKVSAIRGPGAQSGGSGSGGTVSPGDAALVSTTMPKGDLPGWKQNFSEDFTKPAALGQVGNVYDWDLRGYDGFKDTSNNGVYTPDRVLTVADGSLNYNLHTENGQHLVAAPTLNQYNGQTYGRYSVRFRTDSAPGYKISFLLWPSSDKWDDGEFDWPEGNLDYGMMRPALAVPHSTFTDSNGNTNMKFVPDQEHFAPTDSRDWHVATTEWTPSGVKWYWDSTLVASTDLSPSSNFRWTLQAETAIGAPAPADSVKGKVQVDWATSYSYVK